MLASVIAHEDDIRLTCNRSDSSSWYLITPRQVEDCHLQPQVIHNNDWCLGSLHRQKVRNPTYTIRANKQVRLARQIHTPPQSSSQHHPKSISRAVSSYNVHPRHIFSTNKNKLQVLHPKGLKLLLCSKICSSNCSFLPMNHMAQVHRLHSGSIVVRVIVSETSLHFMRWQSAVIFALIIMISSFTFCIANEQTLKHGTLSQS